MDPPQLQVYPFGIPSISNLHPGIPANIVHTLRLDENIVTGDSLDILGAKQAQGVAASLAHLQGQEQTVTDEVVETAKNRAAAIRSTQGQLHFEQGGNAAILALLNAVNNTVNVMNNTIDGLDRRLSRIEVVMENARIVKRN